MTLSADVVVSGCVVSAGSNNYFLIIILQCTHVSNLHTHYVILLTKQIMNGSFINNQPCVGVVDSCVVVETVVDVVNAFPIQEIKLIYINILQSLTHMTYLVW